MSSILRVLVLLIAHLAAPLAVAAAGSEEAASFTAPLAHNLEGAGSKLAALAEAIPADKYSWRSSPEVRAVSEVLMHVVGGNLQLPADLGGGAPEGVEIAATVWDLALQRKRWEEEIVDKATVVEMLRKSFAYAAEAIPSIADLDEQVAPWGFPASKRDYLLILQSHAHEHLGQMIAYTRGLGITPPWSQRPEPVVAESVATFEGSSAHANITAIDQFGNLATTFVASDLSKIGAELGEPLVVEACGGSAEALFGSELFDVRPGEWVAFLSATGHLTVAVSYGSAAETLGCSQSEAIVVRPAESLVGRAKPPLRPTGPGGAAGARTRQTRHLPNVSRDCGGPPYFISADPSHVAMTLPSGHRSDSL